MVIQLKRRPAALKIAFRFSSYIGAKGIVLTYYDSILQRSP
jgi:hypothetical protein